MQSEEKYQICVASLKEFVAQTGFSAVVIGLSGGIDSALAATMCVDALGSKQVYGVLLPGPYSSLHSIEDALALAQNTGIETVTVPITKPYEAFEQALENAEDFGSNGKILHGLAAENVQARCRMIVIMALANSRGWLMVNTGNKSESMMGYSTLYGDSAGAFAPLGGIYKTDVYALAAFRNKQALCEGKTPPIPANTLTKAPSAELSPEQNDELALGISYENLDRILMALVERKESAAQVAQEGFSLAEVKRIERIVKSQAFKRALEPPFPQAAFY